MIEKIKQQSLGWERSEMKREQREGKKKQGAGRCLEGDEKRKRKDEIGERKTKRKKRKDYPTKRVKHHHNHEEQRENAVRCYAFAQLPLLLLFSTFFSHPLLFSRKRKIDK